MDKRISEFWSDVYSEHNCFLFLVHQRSSQRLGQRSEDKTKVRSEGRSKIRVTVKKFRCQRLNFYRRCHVVSTAFQRQW